MVGGAGANTGHMVPRASSQIANQMLFRDFEDSGAVADPDIWTKYNSVMKRPATFDSMLQLWEEMSDWDLMHAALVEVVDEATAVDANSPGSIWYQCNDKDFEDELNGLLVRVDAETIIRNQVWDVASLGNHFEKIEYAPTEGVLGLSFVHCMDMRRYWLERNRKCIGFKWAGHRPDKEPVFVGPDNQTPVERVALSTGKDLEQLYYPWDFMHMRRMYRLRVSEHGEPIFAEAEGIYKKLRIAIDQMVVHRAQVQPDRYAINIDVQEQPPAEQMKTVQRWKQQLRAKLAFGQQGNQGQGLNAPTDFNSFYNAWALDTILYVAQPKGFNHVVNKIAGTTQVPDVYDIELLTDLFYSIIGMPRSWFGGQKDQSTSPSGKALLAQDIRFLRKIKSIRNPIIQAYIWLGYFHAVLKGKNIGELDIKVLMPPIGSLEDQMKLEMLKMQTEVLDVLADVMAKYRLPKEAWIETIFKRYMHLPDDVVNLFITALPTPTEPADAMTGESLKDTSARGMIRLFEEMQSKNPRLRFVVNKMNETWKLESIQRSKLKQYRLREHIMEAPKLHDNDIIINSFGRHPLELKLPNGTNGMRHGSLTEQLDRKVSGNGTITDATEATVPISESSSSASNFAPYRRWMPEKF